MIDHLKKYWICIYPHVYAINKNDKYFLYNTQNGLASETENEICLSLVKEIYEKHNLGVIELNNKYKNSSVCCNFIEEVIKKNIGGIEIIQADKGKPIVLLPILNLQRDVDKMKGKDESLIGDNLLTYLNEINIYLNDNCDLDCEFCQAYSLQTIFCMKRGKDILKPDIIDRVLSQAQFSSLSNVNFLGGNIFLYPHWDELQQILTKYDYKYHFWAHYKTFNPSLVLGNKIDKYYDVLINFPVEIKLIEKNLQKNFNREDTTFRFLIESESDYLMVDDWISKYKLKKYKIIPFYNGLNYDFFKDNVFMEKRDITSSPVTFQKIFCNQKLNSNNFGKLYILPDGKVKANLNKNDIGNIHTDLLLRIIYEELITNTAWRNIRNSVPCTGCFYQHLCPPPSNYEIAIGKPNLCHMNNY